MAEQIIWSSASENDFGVILEYLISHWNERVVLKFIDKIDNTVSLIAKNPKLFPIINKDLKIRKCVITKHNTLFYRSVSKNIEIVRLFDSRQNPNKLIF